MTDKQQYALLRTNNEYFVKRPTHAALKKVNMKVIRELLSKNEIIIE